MKRWIWGALACVSMIAVGRLWQHFPWTAAVTALLSMRLSLLCSALLVNLLSPVEKGWAWSLLLRPIGVRSWWMAQEANLVGTAVNSVTVGVTGEAARVSLIARRSRVPARTVALSVVWVRVVEGIGLALFLVSAPAVLRLPPALRGVQFAAGIGLAIVLALAWYGRSPRWLLRLPRVLRRPAALMVRMGTGRRLLAPILLAAANWVTQWVCYDLVLRAAGIHLPPVASFSALLAVNIGGLGRLTPGNLGVTQAAIVAALLPFGVDVQRSLAAALALQAIQLVPVLALAAAAVGFGGLRGLVRDRASSVLSTGVTLGNSA